MNNEKVYIDGYVVGLFADTLGMKGKRIQLANGDIVDIDDNFIHKSIEPKKVEIPQFVAEYIEKSRLKGWDLLASMCFVLNEKNKKTTKWLYLGENKNIFALAWIFGYEVEKEKRYIIKLKGVPDGAKFLKYAKVTQEWYFGMRRHYSDMEVSHTRKELEDAGFGWVFDCEGIEIEEVKE
jgi:hypothetical protein|nr:MAG TPA: Protein of unknown function (DUF1642) [Caudoviricetes sp.]